MASRSLLNRHCIARLWIVTDTYLHSWSNQCDPGTGKNFLHIYCRTVSVMVQCKKLRMLRAACPLSPPPPQSIRWCALQCRQSWPSVHLYPSSLTVLLSLFLLWATFLVHTRSFHALLHCWVLTRSQNTVLRRVKGLRQTFSSCMFWFRFSDSVPLWK